MSTVVKFLCSTDLGFAVEHTCAPEYIQGTPMQGAVHLAYCLWLHGRSGEVRGTIHYTGPEPNVIRILCDLADASRAYLASQTPEEFRLHFPGALTYYPELSADSLRRVASRTQAIARLMGEDLFNRFLAEVRHDAVTYR